MKEIIIYIYNITYFIIAISFGLSMILIFVLFFIYKTHLIKYSIKNRNFKEMKFSAKISEFLDALFHEPYKNNYLRDRQKITFKSKDEYIFNDKIWNYIQNSFYLAMILAILMAFLMFIPDIFDLGFTIGSK